ncbi:MAG: hypothetical protein MUC43_10800 [Pirellula sp.]|nr:hypothetical protein [Pirellula sp.]
MMDHTKMFLGRAVSLLAKPHLSIRCCGMSIGGRVIPFVLTIACGVSVLSGCANTNGYNGPPYNPYNAYTYPPQQQFGAPGAFQPGGVYPAQGAPMMPNTGAPIGSPGVMPGGTFPTGMGAPPGYNNMPGYNSQPVGGPGQPFIGS